jgi:hypothetical protein
LLRDVSNAFLNLLSFSVHSAVVFIDALIAFNLYELIQSSQTSQSTAYHPEVPSSNLGPETGYAAKFSWVLSVLQSSPSIIP